MSEDGVLYLPGGSRIFTYNLTPEEMGIMFDQVVAFIAGEKEKERQRREGVRR